MILKSLEMQGFKSFPDKIKIEFGSGITAIVGPNGSGKSNVSDAIRWVLGEQSNKTLRSSKMEDVIFTGTALRRPQGFAEVSLTIDNSDRELNIDYNEVTVTRRYYRSGESEYYINKNQTRLRDIHELFMDTGIGRDGYSIIGQGKIAEILSHKSEDRRQVIEEVAGISKYRYRKNEAQRKLDATEDNLLRLNDIVSELEARLPALEQQSAKAKKYLVMYDEKKSLEISIWMAEIKRIRDSARELEEKYNIAKGSLEDISIEIDNFEKEINTIFETNRDINIALEQVRADISKGDEQIAAVNSEIAVFETNVRFETENIEKLKGENESTQQKLLETQSQIDGKNEIISKIKADIDAIEKKSADLYVQIESLSRSGDDVRTQITDYTQQKLTLSEQKNAYEIQKISHTAQISSKNARLLELDGEIKLRRDSLDEVQGEIDKLTAQHAELEGERERNNNSVAGYKKMLDIKQKRYDENRERLEKITAECSALSQNLKILSDMEKHLDGFAGSVKTVLENSRRGTLHGILGTVSQLIRVDKKYITAIETALGNAIQDVVTDNAKNAKNAMLLLKNNRAGRATFLPLSELSPRPAEMSELKGAGIIGLAHTLVDTDSADSNKAVTFLLGRTVVCDTIDNAIAVSRAMKAKYKVVTLDGQVVNPGGSMTGGSTAKSAGLLSRSLEIEKIEKELDAKTRECADIEQSFLKSELDRNELSASLEGVMAKIRACDDELARIDDIKSGKLVVRDSYNELINGFVAEKEQITLTVGEHTEKIADIEKQSSSLDSALAEVERTLEGLVGKNDEKSQSIEGVRAQIADNDIKKLGLFKDIETERSLINQLEAQLEMFKTDASTREGDILSCRERIVQNENGIAANRQKISELESAQAAGKQKINELIDKRSEQEARQASFRTKQRDALASKEKLLQDVTRFENKLSGVSEQTDRIVENLLEYELTLTEAAKVAQPIDDVFNARKRVSELKSSIRSLGSINIGAIEEYAQVRERFDFLDSQMTDLKKSKADLEKIIKELLWQMTTIFTEKFEQLNIEFGKTFTELFGGGKAELILVDPEDVLGCGIDIRVAPPGKIIKNIVSLSGGEQAFSAIALYFAILKIRPTPFCMMDEIEAALDDVNVAKFASKLRDFCEKTQFIVITHRRGTMEEADVLYGVTMQERGISKLLTINVNEMERQLKL